MVLLEYLLLPIPYSGLGEGRDGGFLNAIQHLIHPSWICPEGQSQNINARITFPQSCFLDCGKAGMWFYLDRYHTPGMVQSSTPIISDLLRKAPSPNPVFWIGGRPGWGFSDCHPVSDPSVMDLSRWSGAKHQSKNHLLSIPYSAFGEGWNGGYFWIEKIYQNVNT